MKAALVLTLDDKLSAGLKPMKDGLEKIKQIGKDLGLGKLENAAKPLERANAELRTMASELQTVSREIGAVQSRYARLGQSVRNAGNGIGRGLFGQHGVQNAGQGGGLVAAGAAVAGAVAIGAPIRKFADQEDALRHIVITSNLSGPDADAEIKRITKLTNREALEYSQSSKSIAEAYYGLLTGGAGKPAEVEEALRTHTRAATAYKISPEDFTPVTLTLMKNFKVTGEEMGKALAAVGQAAKEGQLKVPDYARSLPEVAGQFASHGMTGIGNANYAIAALQTIRQDAGEAGEAHTRLNELMNTMYSKSGQRAFMLEGRNDPAEKRDRALMRKATGKDGLDVSGLIDAGAKRGLNPIETMVVKLQQIKAKLSEHEFSDLMAGLVTDQTAMKGWMSLVNHRDFFKELKARLDHIDPAQVDRDFNTAANGPAGGVRRVEEGATQIERRAGEGFSALLRPLDEALQGTIAWIGKLDEGNKGLVDNVLLVTGGMAGLGAALAAIGFLAPPIAAGAGLMTPIVTGAALLAAPAAAAYTVYRDWGNGTLNYGDPSYQPEFGIPLMNQEEWDSRHTATPPSAGRMIRAPRHEGGVGQHWQWEPANSGATHGTLEINIHTEPGTLAEVGRAPEGVMINSRTNPGMTLGRP